MKNLFTILIMVLWHTASFSQKDGYVIECSECSLDYGEVYCSSCPEKSAQGVTHFDGLNVYDSRSKEVVSKIPRPFTYSYINGYVKIETTTKIEYIDGKPTWFEARISEYVYQDLTTYPNFYVLSDSLNVCLGICSSDTAPPVTVDLDPDPTNELDSIYANGEWKLNGDSIIICPQSSDALGYYDFDNESISILVKTDGDLANVSVEVFTIGTSSETGVDDTPSQIDIPYVHDGSEFVFNGIATFTYSNGCIDDVPVTWSYMNGNSNLLYNTDSTEIIFDDGYGFNDTISYPKMFEGTCHDSLLLNGKYYSFGKPNKIVSGASVFGNPIGEYHDIDFRGENDSGSLDTETTDISQKVFQVTEVKDCIAETQVIVENYSTQTRVNSVFGNDATGMINRTDKPFKTISAAKNAMDVNGLLQVGAFGQLPEYSLLIEAGNYTDGNISGVTSGEALKIQLTGLPTIDCTFSIAGGILAVTGDANWLNTPANTSTNSNQFATNGGTLYITGGTFRNIKGGWTFALTNGGSGQANIDYILGGVNCQDSNFTISLSSADANLPDAVGYNGLFKCAALTTTQSSLYVHSKGKLTNSQNELTTSSGTGKGAHIFSANQGGSIYADFILAQSDNGSVAHSSTNNANISEIHLLSGRCYSNSNNYATLITDVSSVTETSRIFVYGSCVLISTNYGFSLGSPTIGSEIRLYDSIATNSPSELGTSILTGTLSINSNTL